MRILYHDYCKDYHHRAHMYIARVSTPEIETIMIIIRNNDIFFVR